MSNLYYTKKSEFVTLFQPVAMDIFIQNKLNIN